MPPAPSAPAAAAGPPARAGWAAKTLEGDRVRLRAWRAGDDPDLLPRDAEAGEPGLVAAGRDAAWRDAHAARMAAGEGVFWCVADAATDAVLGGTALTRLDRPATRGTGRFDLWLLPDARGEGLAADATDLLVDHAFAARSDLAGLAGGIGLHRLEAFASDGARDVGRALRRAGFRPVGHERSVLARAGGRPAGRRSFELLATDDRVAQTVEPAIVPALRTLRLRLRPWDPGDLPRTDQELDRDALRFLPVGAQPTTATYAAWLAGREREIDAGDVPWCIADAATDEPLGFVGLYPSWGAAPGDAGLAYWVYPEHRGRGYAAEALAAVIEYAFDRATESGLGLHRVHAEADVANAASLATLAASGLVEWGRAHAAHVRPDGTIGDLAHLELLAPDRR